MFGLVIQGTECRPPLFSRATAGNSLAGHKAEPQAAPAASLQGIKAAGAPIRNVPHVPEATRSVYTALLQQHTQASHPQCRIWLLKQAFLPLGLISCVRLLRAGALQALATALARTQGGRRALSSLTKELEPLIQVRPRVSPRSAVADNLRHALEHPVRHAGSAGAGRGPPGLPGAAHSPVAAEASWRTGHSCGCSPSKQLTAAATAFVRHAAAGACRRLYWLCRVQCLWWQRSSASASDCQVRAPLSCSCSVRS